jgi:DNA phosphorothioation-associated putative methyltransferase
VEVERHRSALSRGELSRPLRLAISDGLLSTDRTLMDYGCGRGDDVARLRDAGWECTGWDPAHAPDGERRRSSVVNLGYVVNVIEDVDERREVLRSAWALADELLVVSARLIDERPSRSTVALGDGIITRIGTFQKFFEQQELRAWIDQSLGCQSVAGAPGVFYVFRSADARTDFIAHRFRRREPLPSLRMADRLVERHRDLLDALAAFLLERGRLPEANEFPLHEELLSALGSMARAHRLLMSASEPRNWERVRVARSEDLLVYLALAKFDGRPAFGDLPASMRLDVKAFFGSYAKACGKADDLLFSIGSQERLNAAALSSPLGKLLPTALYAHVCGVTALPLPLRLYEGCGRAALGVVDGATIVKLRRDEPKVSYLSYPTFDREAHPSLSGSISVHLQTFKVRTRRYEGASNPPILHRKESFVPEDYAARSRFSRLTAAEERAGLLSDTARIGTREGWADALADRGLAVKGHRLVRRSGD